MSDSPMYEQLFVSMENSVTCLSAKYILVAYDK